MSAALVLMATAGGCGKSEVRYSDDDDDGSGGQGLGTGTGGQGLTSTGTGGTPAGQVPAPGEADGTFFMALATVLFPPTPIVFEAELTTSAGAAGLEVTLDLQPLASSDRQTPVGAPISIGGPYPVAADGSFTLLPPLLSVPGEANPISGNVIEVDVSLSGTLLTPADFICGDVVGETTQPPGIDIDGSTFTLERIASPGPPYPEPPRINCAGDLAQPL